MTRLSRHVAALLLAAASASARADAGGFAVDRFQLDPGAHGILGVASARVPAFTAVNLSLGFQYADSLLRLEQAGKETALVSDSYAAQVAGAIALGGRLELGLVAPVVLSRSTESGGSLPSAAVSGLGDLRVVPKVVLSRGGALRLAVSLPFTIPTAKKGSFMGDGAFTATPTGIAEVQLGRARVAADVGYAVRPTRTLYDLELGNAVTYGAAGELPFEAAGQTWAALASAWGEVGIGGAKGAASPCEGDLALRWGGEHGVAVTAGAGTAIVNGYGAPGLRVFALVGWRPRPALPARKEEPPPMLDPCASGQPHAPEQCPDLDDDLDGIPNGIDRCPLVPGVAAEGGCRAKPAPRAIPLPPPPKVHPCAKGQPHAPEQCPNLDDDGDGIPNGKDRCPLVPGMAQYQGCPPPKAVLTGKKIEIKEAVFFDNAKDTIQRRSFQLLDDVARLLEDHPEVKRVSIQGHTDSSGDRLANVRLSERRAVAVKAYLVSRGISPGRLEAHGFGASRPVAKNTTAAGRGKNRRVEFIVAP